MGPNRQTRQENKRRRAAACESLLEWKADPSSQEAKFMPVIHTWLSSKKIRVSMLLALATTCKTMFRMVLPLIIEKGWIGASNAQFITLYKCKNIIINKSDTSQHLQRLLEIPGYTIQRIHIIRHGTFDKGTKINSNIYDELDSIRKLIDKHLSPPSDLCTPSSSPSSSLASSSLQSTPPHTIAMPTITLPSPEPYLARQCHLKKMRLTPFKNFELTNIATTPVGDTVDTDNYETKPYFKYSLALLENLSLANDKPLSFPKNVSHLSINIPLGSVFLNLPQHLHSLCLFGESQYHFTSLPDNIYKYKRTMLNHHSHPQLAPSLRKVVFGLFQSPVINSLHLPHLQYLSLRGEFNSPLNNLPTTLTHIRIRGSYVYPLCNLPPQLKTLKLNLYLDQFYILGTLPLSLQILKINCLKIAKLLGGTTTLPPHLQHLTLVFRREEVINIDLPDSLSTVTLYGELGYITCLPPSLEVLDMGRIEILASKDNSIPTNTISNLLAAPLYLPSKLLSLAYPSFFNLPLTTLPPNLTFIQFGAEFDQTIACLPTTITTIVFHSPQFTYSHFNQPLHLQHLTQLQELRFTGSSAFDQPITSESLPSSLLRLQFVGFPQVEYHADTRAIPAINYTTKFNQLLDMLPQSVQTLVLGPSFEHRLLQHKRLCTLVIAQEYPHPIPSCTIYRYKYCETPSKKEKRHQHHRFSKDYVKL